MKKLFLIILMIMLAKSGILCQPHSIKESNAASFFEYLSADQGWWKADNVEFIVGQDGSYTHFLAHFVSLDPMSLRATIHGVNVQSDTTRFWEIWEFFDREENTTRIVQRSPNGMYAISKVLYDSPIVRHSELVFKHLDGQSFKHKDRHQIFMKNKMISESFDFDSELNDWGPKNSLTWYRQTINK